MIDDYVDFIVKEKTTPWFGLNIDFGVFQNRRSPRAASDRRRGRLGAPGGRSGARGSMGGAVEPSRSRT